MLALLFAPLENGKVKGEKSEKRVLSNTLP